MMDREWTAILARYGQNVVLHRDGGKVQLRAFLQPVLDQRGEQAVPTALGLRRGDAQELPPYIRVLAMDDRGKALLRRMSKTAALPLIVKPAAVRELDDVCRRVFDLGSSAHDLYVLGCSRPEERRGGADWRATPYIQ